MKGGPALKNDILDYLTRNGTAKRKNLIGYLWHTGREISDRELRETIVSMQQDDGHLIISSPKGYKLCENVAEYERAISYLNSYIFSLLKKRRAMKNNFQRLIRPQLFT